MKNLFFWLAGLSALTSMVMAFSDETDGECCVADCSRQIRITPRYTTPKGIGYHKGYTTLEGFFTPTGILRDSWLPFLDLRGHVFDNGKCAANAGLGVRYLSQCRIWGMNGYYDYRASSHQHYNQVAAGFETLGEIWDFRVNGYLPVGKKSHYSSHGKFYSFNGNSLLLKVRQKFAMGGVNAETGYHFDCFRNVPLYFAGGPYYLHGKNKTTWGGQLRAVAQFFQEGLRFEVDTSYDHFFKWTGQGQVSLNFTFGRKSNPTRDRYPSCCESWDLCERALQRVDRNEIIPEGKRQTIDPAINPATGQPWVFWFVNNLSHSAGTYQSPFPTLLEAQKASSANQSIYVFTGDGTTKGMNGGITLQNGQLLLGSSVPHGIATTKGLITIPSMTTLAPSITNTNGDVVIVANNNTVSGFSIAAIQNGSNGVTGTGIFNSIVDQNYFTTLAGITTNGVKLLNPSGQIVVSRSSFDGFSCIDGSSDGNGIVAAVDSPNPVSTLSVLGSTFNNITNPGSGSGGNGIIAAIQSGTINTFNISDSTFNSISNGYGIQVLSLGTFNNVNVLKNTFTNLKSAAFGMGINGTSTISNLTSMNNTFSNLSGTSIGINNTTTINNFYSSGDTFSNLSTQSTGISNGSMSALIQNLTISHATFNTLTNQSTGANNLGVITTVNSSGNAFTNINQSSCFFNEGAINTWNATNNTFTNLTGLVAIPLSTPSSGFVNAGSITTLNSRNNTFTTLTNSFAIQNLLTITTVNSSNDIFNTISGADHGESGGIYSGSIAAINTINLTNGIFNNFMLSDGIDGQITTLNASNNLFTNFNASNGLNGASATTNSTNNTFDTFLNSSNGIASGSTLTASLKDTFNNFNSSIAILSSSASTSSPVITLTTSNDVFSNLNGGIGVEFSSTNSAYNSSGDRFTNLTQGSYGIYNENGVLTILAVSNDTFEKLDGGSTGIASFGSTTTFNSSHNTFNNLTKASFGINLGSTVNTINSSNDAFDNVSTSSMAISIPASVMSLVPGQPAVMNILNDSFGITDNTGAGFSYQPPITIGTTNPVGLNLSGNVFKANDDAIKGYGVNINVQSGTSLCLDFTGNTALPASNPDPYVFQNSNILNYANVSGNTGTISYTGTPPGTCTFP